jgi:heterodisulfide reductase subunit C
MKIQLTADALRSDLARRVQEMSGEDPLACYQCGKCSAGCPSAAFMDQLPNQIIRLLQLGSVAEALRSDTIWYCAACQTCYARCPKGVDLPRLMEALRELALQELGDQVDVAKIDAGELARLPQQAFVAGFRKYTG